jgi:CRISPR-associated endonuclease/helicase Cas3
VVVATQTLEVGADFDFHVLLTESASYPALRQRLGRLNRLGRHSGARAAIVHVEKGADDDPVYGESLARTWAFLKGQSGADKTIDLGLSVAPIGSAELAPKPPQTPYLTPPLVDLLAQTCPRPALDPDLAALLHGFTEREADLALVWRDGIESDKNGIDRDRAAVLLEHLPPTGPEQMPISRPALRAWLKSLDAPKERAEVDEADVESTAEPFEVDRKLSVRLVLALRGDQWLLRSVDQLHAGETIVVPSEWGGADSYGFAPSSRNKVVDLAAGARQMLKLRTVSAWTAPPEGWDDATWRGLLQRIEQDDLSGHALRDALLEAGWPTELTELRPNATRVEALHTADELFGIVAFAIKPSTQELADERSLQRTVTVPVELHAHCRGVADFARQTAEALALPAAWRDDLVLAARLHDLGKADPRFQAQLGASGPALYAKGSAQRGRPMLEERDGERHEAYSVAAALKVPKLLDAAHDRDLVLHLIGAHHGFGRPFMPVRKDAGCEFSTDVDGISVNYQGRSAQADLASGWADRFAVLNQRYGPWRLAYLETLLRFADFQRSAQEVKDSQ